MKIPRRVGLGVLRAGQTVFQSQQILRFETDLGLQQLAEAANEQAGGDQEQNGEGDLRDDETAAHAIPASAAAAAASAFFQSGLQLRPRHVQSGDETKQPSGENGDRERKEKNARIDGRVLRADKVLRQLEQSPQAPVRQEHARAAAGQAEHGRFRQQLPNEPPSARAQRRPHRHFPLPREPAREQEIRQVRARDEENRSGRQKEQPEHRSHLTDDELLVEIDLHAAPGVLLRISGRELARDRIRFRLRLSQAGIRLQMAQRNQKARIASRCDPGKVRHRKPDFDIRIERVLERGRNDAHHTVGLAVENQFLVREIGIAIQALTPELLVDDRDLRRAGLIFSWRQRAAENWSEMENFKKIRGNERAPNAIGALAAGQVDALRLESGQVLERMHLLSKVLQLGHGEAVAISRRGGRKEVDQSRGIVIGQRAKKDRIDDAEDGGVRADAEREGEDGDGGETGGF